MIERCQCQAAALLGSMRPAPGHHGRRFPEDSPTLLDEDSPALLDEDSPMLLDEDAHSFLDKDPPALLDEDPHSFLDEDLPTLLDEDSLETCKFHFLLDSLGSLGLEQSCQQERSFRVTLIGKLSKDDIENRSR